MDHLRPLARTQADQVATTYLENYRQLVRIAAMLLFEPTAAEDVVQEASMAKWWTTDLQKRLTGECVQLHGGYGFMTEYPIATDYADAAVQSIYAGTNEIMKVIIARRMGLG